MRRWIWIFTGMVLQGTLLGQADLNISREDYISSYADLAMREMARVGIPASITLAQGCLESNNGNSRLAVKGNNHFGIKCHDWEGKRIHQNDDAWRECFRSYPSAYDSFRDHSDFLTNRSRYAFLFQLEPDDYRGWANGLKKAGYATSPGYARELIRIIEENQLHMYDQLVLEEGLETGPDRQWLAGGGPDTERQPGSIAPRVAESGHTEPHPVLVNNRIEYIVVRPGDTPDELRNELDLYPNEIYRYNDLSPDAKLEPGQIIYLQPKRRRAARGNEIHVVEEGQTMYDISQIYAVKLKHLYRMNLLTEGAQPLEGTEIYLRRKRHDTILRPDPEPEPESPEEVEMQFEFDG